MAIRLSAIHDSSMPRHRNNVRKAVKFNNITRTLQERLGRHFQDNTMYMKKATPTKMLNITSVKELMLGKTNSIYKIVPLVIIEIGCNRYSINEKPEVFFATKFCMPNS